MAEIKAPWVVMAENGAKCTRCGAAETMPLPMSVTDLVKWTRRFITGHEGCTSGLTSDYWYDRSLRLYIVTVKDQDGNQVGDAEYEPAGCKHLAKRTAARMLREAEEKRAKGEL